LVQHAWETWAPEGKLGSASNAEINDFNNIMIDPSYRLSVAPMMDWRYSVANQ